MVRSSRVFVDLRPRNVCSNGVRLPQRVPPFCPRSPPVEEGPHDHERQPHRKNGQELAICGKVEGLERPAGQVDKTLCQVKKITQRTLCGACFGGVKRSMAMNKQLLSSKRDLQNWVLPAEEFSSGD
eukprot:83316-Pelagomonas_calceolata.AAC.6